MANYVVYVLINGVNPIYVGKTNNIAKRLANHRKSKLFTSHQIIEEFENEQEALAMERGIIKFTSMFKKYNLDNAPYSAFNIKSDILSHTNQKN